MEDSDPNTRKPGHTRKKKRSRTSSPEDQAKVAKLDPIATAAVFDPTKALTGQNENEAVVFGAEEDKSVSSGSSSSGCSSSDDSGSSSSSSDGSGSESDSSSDDGEMSEAEDGKEPVATTSTPGHASGNVVDSVSGSGGYGSSDIGSGSGTSGTNGKSCSTGEGLDLIRQSSASPLSMSEFFPVGQGGGGGGGVPMDPVFVDQGDESSHAAALFGEDEGAVVEASQSDDVGLGYSANPVDEVSTSDTSSSLAGTERTKSASSPSPQSSSSSVQRQLVQLAPSSPPPQPPLAHSPLLPHSPPANELSTTLVPPLLPASAPLPPLPVQPPPSQPPLPTDASLPPLPVRPPRPSSPPPPTDASLPPLPVWPPRPSSPPPLPPADAPLPPLPERPPRPSPPPPPPASNEEDDSQASSSVPFDSIEEEGELADEGESTQPPSPASMNGHDLPYGSYEGEEDLEEELDEEEIEAMLEQSVPAMAPKQQEEEEEEPKPRRERIKYVLEECGNAFEVLPVGWIQILHISGMPLYLERKSRVITASKPYFLGTGSARRHHIPLEAIPCLQYAYVAKKLAAEEKEVNSMPAEASAVVGQDGMKGVAAVVGESASDKSGLAAAEGAAPGDAPAEPSDAGDKKSQAPAPPANGASPKSACPFRIPRGKVECVDEKKMLAPEEFKEYCLKRFRFREVSIRKFDDWNDRKRYEKYHKRKRVKEAIEQKKAEAEGAAVESASDPAGGGDKASASVPSLPEGTRIITVPVIELQAEPGGGGGKGGGDNAMNQRVVRRSKKEWLLNPQGKSSVCILHEYLQHCMKKQPVYTYVEVASAATPYGATVSINGIEYGKGVGASKKQAKNEAAQSTLDILIPDLKKKSGPREDDKSYSLSYFDTVATDDPRVPDLCNRTGEPAPYTILQACLQRNFGLGDASVHHEVKPGRNKTIEYVMRVNTKTVTETCTNKRAGKQRAAQKMLLKLHPNLVNWGCLLRMYGNRSHSVLKQKAKKKQESEVTELQARNSSRPVPCKAILNKLKEEMRQLSQMKKSVVPIGKFLPPLDASTQGEKNTCLDKVDL